MDITQLARDFVKLMIEEDEEGIQSYWSDDIVSIEAEGAENARTEGRAALIAKHAWWTENAEVHSVETDGPYVNGNQFTVRFTIDVTMFGERTKSSEIALYTFANGKIVEERFFAPKTDW